jgi:polyvinyl alcohol dehydrogenase (cytochrome)
MRGVSPRVPARAVRTGRRAALVVLALVGAGCGGAGGPEPAAAPAADAGPHPGDALYRGRCAMCHEGGSYKAPDRLFLGMMAPEAILESLDGVMATQSAGLTPEQKRAVAEFLAGRPIDATPAAAAPACSEPDLDMDRPPAQRTWGVDLANRRFQPAASGGLTLDDAAGLELKWAFAYPGAIQARSQPTVAGGTVFVGSARGVVYALDARRGCVRWTYRASAEVRTPVVVTGWHAGDREARPRAYFGDILARAYAVDARTGALLWMTRVDDHAGATITGAPVPVEDRVYVPVSSLEVAVAGDPRYACCTFRGAMVALDAGTGAIRWKRHTIEQPAADAGRTSAGTKILAPSGAPIWNSPTVDLKRRRLYAGTGENYSSPAGDTSDAIIAFDMDSGAIRWVAQATRGDAWNVGCLSELAPDPANCPEENGPDFDFAAPPMLIELGSGRDVLVAGQKSGEVMALDPDTGEFLWRRKVGRGGVQGGTHFGMAAEGARVYVPINDMRYPEDITRYGFTEPPRPGLYALDAASGRELWASPADDVCSPDNNFCDPGISAAITAIPGAVVAGHLDGRLRVYAGADGRVAWTFDTVRDFDTVSGEKARGGSMSGGGPAVAGGMLYVNSGYGIYQHMPGNVLLAFGLRERED